VVMSVSATIMILWSMASESRPTSFNPSASQAHITGSPVVFVGQVCGFIAPKAQ
jgi:hypothetical protein